jgi:pimeloyl-ACP methyl ester carboxylesterase
LAPLSGDGMGKQWFEGMTDSNVTEYKFAANDPEELTWRLAQTAAKITANPTSHVSTLSPEMPLDDRRVVADAGIRSLLAQNFAEGLKESANGWIDDLLAFCAPWRFDPADIKVPVRLWHGKDDVFSPVAHTRWLADRIPGSQLVIQPDSAHFAALEAVPDMLSWLIRRSPATTGTQSSPQAAALT